MPEQSKLVEEAREEWEALGLMSYHGAGFTEVMYADIDEEGIARIRNLIRELARRLEQAERALTEIVDYSCYGTAWNAYADVKRIARAALSAQPPDRNSGHSSEEVDEEPA